MKVNWRVISVVIFCISASLIIPKVADATGNLNRSSSASNSRDDKQIIKNFEQNPQDEEAYVPPNYGGPDSQHGSGTR
ncbi:hypothetical protein [Anabaena subtropica]|uniref:Uncharacterized protein n=1 Tax=Anabaena subtropica FACHB-260 TaxID=2692884 RepID=A0ABR8CJX8_9NOST|nr:hypothetical protein [Anabaena subtropica]MBD2343076.1 hypothetical protein [Anabaena subtropica FACHB-260]